MSGAPGRADRRVAVSGAHGYLGRHLMPALRAAGYEPVGLSRRPGPGELAYQLGEAPSLRGCHALVHAAHDFSDRVDNVAAARRILGQAVADGVQRVIFISSLAAFPGCVSRYGQAKLAIEGLVGDLSALSVRPGTIWGGASGGLMASLERLAHRAPVLPALTGRDLSLRLVHVDDVCQSIVEALGAPKASGVVSLAHERAHSLAGLLRHLAGQHGRRPVMVPVPASLAHRALRLCELAGLRLPLRSDSLLSLMHANPAPDLQRPEWMRVSPRPFGE